MITKPSNQMVQFLYVFLLLSLQVTVSNANISNNKNYIGVPPIKLNNPPDGKAAFLSPHSVKLDTADSLKPSKEINPFLQIPCSVQADTDDIDIPLSCYVDTGAQVSVLSLDAVQKMNLLHQIDKKYTGKAQGVGNSVEIIGRIPSIKLKLKNGNQLYLNNVIILKDTGGVDLLLGLDVLHKYEAQIDLKRHRITFFNENEMREKIFIEFSNEDLFDDI